MVASAGEKPRFRQDLVAEPIEDGAARFIDVADPDTGALFRFYEVEYSLACAMDGERDVAGIVQWAKEELGLAPSAKEVQNVIATLRDLGYLERGAAAAAAAMPAAVGREAPKPAVQSSGVKVAAGKPSPNKWDQPTAMGDSDDYLEPGVVVPKGGHGVPAADDLELGQAGATSAKVETDLPRSADLELGAPGAAAAPAGRGSLPKSADVQLGTPGRSDVSIDLADHMAVGTEDVKEAVRQSQVMKAVDVPKELLEAAQPTAAPASKKAESSKAEKRAEAKAERKAEADRKLEADRKAEADRKTEADRKADAKEARAEAKDARAEAKEAKADRKAEAKADKKVEKRVDAKGKPAVEAPRQAEKRPVAPPAPKTGTSPVLIVLFVLVVLAAGAFLAYRYVFKKDTTAETKAPPTPVQPTQVEPPAPPPVETVKLATEQQDPVDLKAVGAGQIETIVANDSAAKSGDVIAQLAGHKGIDAEVAAMQKDIDTRVKPELDKAEKDRDAAQTAGNKAAVTAAEARIADRKKSLEDKQAKLSAKKADLAKLQIKAPSDGKVTTVAKASARVAAGDVVAKLARTPVLAATFKTASGVTPQSHVVLATKSGGQKLSCTVVTADASGVKIACPGDAATDGTEVTFVGVDPNAPAAQGSGEIEMSDEGSAAAGSATMGSAAGSATPAAGSAATGSADAGSADATPKAPAKAPAKAPPRPRPAAHVPAKAPATPPADKPADQPADKPAPPPADKPADVPAPAPASDSLK